MYYWKLYIKKIDISSSAPTGPKEILLNGKAGIYLKLEIISSLLKK